MVLLEKKRGRENNLFVSGFRMDTDKNKTLKEAFKSKLGSIKFKMQTR